MTTLTWVIILLAVAVICFLVCWLADERATARRQLDLLDEKAATIAAKDQAIASIGQRLAIRDRTIELMLGAQLRAEDERGFELPTLVKSA